MRLESVLALQDSDAGDVIRALVILLFFVAPVIKRIFEARAEKKPTPQRRPPRPTTQEPAGQRPEPAPPPGPVSWEDLMQGRAGAAPPVEADFPEIVVAPFEESQLEQDIHERPLVPEFDLPPVAHEDALEVSLPDPVDLVSLPDAPLETLSDFVEGEGSLTPEFRGLSDLSSDRGPALQARARSLVPKPGDWRRAVIAAEVLGPPLALRDQQSHTGPPLFAL